MRDLAERRNCLNFPRTPGLHFCVLGHLKLLMKVGYSLLIDEYVDADLVEPTDLDALRIVCAVCQQTLTLGADSEEPTFRHTAAADRAQVSRCEFESELLVPADCSQHNRRARLQRIAFFRRCLSKEVLRRDPGADDPIAPCPAQVAHLFSKENALESLSWLTRLHWDSYFSQMACALVDDPAGFFDWAEEYLGMPEHLFEDVPASGYRRRVHILAAFDLMQFFVDSEGQTEDYQWLFLHALRLCLEKWTYIAQVKSCDRIKDSAMREELIAQTGAARVVSSCIIDLMLGDKKAVKHALRKLETNSTGPPVIHKEMSLRMFLDMSVAGEMEATLFRLPYLPILGSYSRPCQPPPN